MGRNTDSGVGRNTDSMESCSPEEVTACDKSPQKVRARSLLCFWGYRRIRISTNEIAGVLDMSQPAMSRFSRRGERIERENRVLRDVVGELD